MIFHKYVAADLLVAWLDIALDHQTLDKFMKFRINIAAVQNFLGDTNLLVVLLVGVGVVGIHDHCRVLEIFFLIFFKKKTKILIMIVWHCSPCLLTAPRRIVCARGFPSVSTSQLR